jgi:hypothetical protein
MSPRNQYQVSVSKLRGWWYIEVPVATVRTESRYFYQAELAAREAIATSLDVDADSFDLAIELRPDLERSSSGSWSAPAG